MKIVRARPVEPADAFYVAKHEGRDLARITSKTVTVRLGPLLIGAVILVAALVGFFFYVNSQSKQVSVAFDSNAVVGKVSLTGAELRQLVAQEAITAYWVGPEPGARYALSVLADGRVFVRYLPENKGLDDIKPAYKVIATYVTTNAFTKTQNAATTAGGVGMVNADGDAIYYASDRPTNVYVGLKGEDYQVEIYDPVPGQALKAAQASGLVRKIS